MEFKFDLLIFLIFYSLGRNPQFYHDVVWLRRLLARAPNLCLYRNPLIDRGLGKGGTWKNGSEWKRETGYGTKKRNWTDAPRCSSPETDYQSEPLATIYLCPNLSFFSDRRFFPLVFFYGRDVRVDIERTWSRLCWFIFFYFYEYEIEYHKWNLLGNTFLGLTVFHVHWVPLGCTEFHRVPPSSTRFNWVSLGSTRFCSVLLGSTRSCLV